MTVLNDQTEWHAEAHSRMLRARSVGGLFLTVV